MKKILIGAVFFTVSLAPLSVFAQSTAGALQPFGGSIVAEYLCNTGLLLYIKPGEPAPPSEPITLMWLWGELPYSNYIIPHINQEILGMAAPATVPCVLAFITIGSGYPILYHGGSF